LLVTREDLDTSQAVLYRNTGGGTFTPMPASTIGGIVHGNGVSTSPLWSDYDNDGFVDIFVARGLGPDCLYRNNGDGTFKSVVNDLIDPATQFEWSPGWADYNNDGLPDLLFSKVGDLQGRRAFKNLGAGNFQAVTLGSFNTDGGVCFGSAWGDYDNDGFLDLFLVNALKGEASFLYHNNANGTFTRMISDQVGSIASDPGGFSACAWGDYDNDGFLDLFVTATAALGAINSDWATSGGNALYHNNGDGSFTRISTGPPVENIACRTGYAGFGRPRCGTG
jgi:hypothetical protein